MPHFVYPFIHDGLLGCFQLLAIVENAVMNTGIQISVQVSAFNSLGHIPRSGIAGSHGNSIFNLLRILSVFFFYVCFFKMRWRRRKNIN